MKTSRVLTCVVLLIAAVGFTVGAEGITLLADSTTPAAPMLGQPGSLIEVYGVIDAALRVATDMNSSGDTYLNFSQGLFNGSRVGFRGTEGLGGSFKAIYALETGVILPVGTLDQQGQIFGRQAWVGVSSDYGRLTFGRQYGEFSDAIGVGDVFGANHGNAPYFSTSGTGNNYGSNDAVNAFFLQESGLRWDNSIKYDANFSGVVIGGMAMLGSIPGSTNIPPQNTMYAASLGYNSKDFPVTVTVGFQTELDFNDLHHNDFGGGIKYAFDPTDAVYAFYFHSVFDQGFSRINSNNSEFGASATNPNVLAYGRTDDIAGVAANYYLTPSFNLIAAYYLDYGQNVINSADTGTRNSILVVADYYFTKNFDSYLAGSYTMFSGDFANTLNGGDYFYVSPGNQVNVFSVMAGMRFRF